MHCEAFGQRVGTIGRCLECSISSTLPGYCISYYENRLRLLHKLESICSKVNKSGFPAHRNHFTSNIQELKMEQRDSFIGRIMQQWSLYRLHGESMPSNYKQHFSPSPPFSSLTHHTLKATAPTDSQPPS
jgi:hypothetical protein